MNIRELENWLIELANLNSKNKRLKEEIDNLRLLIIPPFRSDILPRLMAGLNAIIEIANPYLPKEDLLALATKKKNFQEVVYPQEVTAGMMLEEIRKGEWKSLGKLKEAIENHKAKLNSIFSRYNPFLSSPETKIQALEKLEDYLNSPNVLAPNARSVHELIEAWKKGSLASKDEFIEESQGEDESCAVIIGKHRNRFYFFSQPPRDLNTSTQDFIDSIDKAYGNKSLKNGS